MGIFSKRKSTGTGTLKIEEVKVATTIIISSYNDGSGLGPRRVKWYFLVREVNGKYHEIFSDKQIEKEEDTHHNGFTSQSFDTPYIQKLEPLTQYLRNPKTKVIELQLLFDFILDMNVQEQLGTSEESED